MPLNIQPGPELAIGTFLAGLAPPPDNRIRPHLSVSIWTLSVPELAGAATVLTPHRVGWYFVALDGTRLAAGEVPDVPDAQSGGPPLTTTLNYGRMVESSWKAFEVVKAHPELQAEPFDLRWLRLAEIGIEAFWLKASPFDETLGAADKLYTILTFRPELKDQLLPATTFLNCVRKLAAVSLTIDTTPKL